MGSYATGLTHGAIITFLLGLLMMFLTILTRDCIKAHREDHETRTSNNV